MDLSDDNCFAEHIMGRELLATDCCEMELCNVEIAEECSECGQLVGLEDTDPSQYSLD